ncbi:MAG: hypothetical protein KF740_05610 [Ramlibacter sp.]|nr:hypothetical protein [Ramlibacter sp.]
MNFRSSLPHMPRLCKTPIRRRNTVGQKGIALIFVLVMMSIISAVAIIAARTTLLSERAARNDRDRQVAFQAAEMALNDAERDIMDPTIDVPNKRACLFGKAVMAEEGKCQSSATRRGVCKSSQALDDADTPMYKAVDWNDTSDATRAYVNYGEFTGRGEYLQTGNGGGPVMPPKYIIVQSRRLTKFPVVGQPEPGTTPHGYRVYALGYGASRETQVLLEAVFVKPLMADSCVGDTI